MKNSAILVMLCVFCILLSSCQKEVKDSELPIKVETHKGVIDASGSGYEIYPNPFHNVVRFTVYGGQSYELNISDNKGRVRKIDLVESNSIAIDFSDCGPGFYYCEIIIDGVAYREYLLNNSGE